MKALLLIAAVIVGFIGSALAAVIPSDKDQVISLDGSWRFKLEQAHGDYDGPPRLRQRPEPDFPKEPAEAFFQPDYKEAEGWHDIKVPGNWEMFGHSPATYNQPDNASGFYRLAFDVPKSWEGRIIKINFDGVQQACEIWLNGQPVKADEPTWGRENYHECGWTAFQVDLTPHVKFGEKNLLALRVFKNSKSADLDTGDYFLLGGVHRPVTLFAVPKTHLQDLTVQARLRDENKKAELKVIAAIPKGAKAKASLQLEGVTGATEASPDDNGQIVLTKVVENPRLWSAESPNRYPMTVELKDESGNILQRYQQKIGFREVTIKDAVLLLNGKPIKMAGMCRHDVSAQDGTAVGPDLWRKDIELMKAANVNAIRTSHYPYGKGFYELCDELGMYVADELPYCWTPTDDKAMTPAFEQRARETIRRDKNFACVLVWAIGNENKEGQNLQIVADLVKKLDDTRPRAVSCIGGAKYKTELSDSHYTVPQKVKESADRAKKVGRPHIYLENPNNWDVRLAADPSCWDAWAPVLQRSWDVVMREETLPGAFNWEWQDRAIADKNDKRLYYFDEKTGINYFKIKGIVDAFRNPRPWYYHIKMIYSPIRVGEKLDFSGSDAVIDLENRYSFTSLDQVRTKWQLIKDGKPIQSGEATANVPPLTKGKLQLKLPDGAKDADALRVDFEDSGGRNIVAHQFTLNERPSGSMSAQLPENLPFPQFNLITRMTENNRGTWRKVTRFHAKLKMPAPSNLKDGEKFDSDLVMENEPDKVVGRVHAEYASNKLSYRINWTGEKAEVQELGWIFSMPKSHDRFSWKRDALWTIYPDTHIGRPAGTARPDSMNVAWTKVDRPDAFDFNSTKYNCRFAALTDEQGQGLRVEFDPKDRHQCRAGSDGSGYTLTVNKHVSPPNDISTSVVRDLYLTLEPGKSIEGTIKIGSNNR